jgi:hypothetical protein
VHFTHRVAQVFVHERVKEWSSKLETFSSPIVIEVLDSDDDDDDDDDDGDDSVYYYDGEDDDHVIDF